MTIKDLLEQGIQLQGKIKIIKWDHNMEKVEETSCGSGTNAELSGKEITEYEDDEIIYMYAQKNTLVIEIIEK